MEQHGLEPEQQQEQQRRYQQPSRYRQLPRGQHSDREQVQQWNEQNEQQQEQRQKQAQHEQQEQRSEQQPGDGQDRMRMLQVLLDKVRATEVAILHGGRPTETRTHGRAAHSPRYRAARAAQNARNRVAFEAALQQRQRDDSRGSNVASSSTKQEQGAQGSGTTGHRWSMLAAGLHFSCDERQPEAKRSMHGEPNATEVSKVSCGGDSRSTEDGITLFDGDEIRAGKRAIAKHSPGRDASSGPKRHKAAEAQQGKSRGAKRCSTWSTDSLRRHSNFSHRSMCPGTETYKYGGSDTDGPDQGIPAASDVEAIWWNTEPPATTAEDRAEHEWWQTVEDCFLAEQLVPSTEPRTTCTRSELLGEALTEAGDQGIWSSSEGE